MRCPQERKLTTAVIQFGQKRSFCPAGVRSREATPKQPGLWGGGESMYDVRFENSAAASQGGGAGNVNDRVLGSLFHGTDVLRMYSMMGLAT